MSRRTCAFCTATAQDSSSTMTDEGSPSLELQKVLAAPSSQASQEAFRRRIVGVPASSRADRESSETGPFPCARHCPGPPLANRTRSRTGIWRSARSRVCAAEAKASMRTAWTRNLIPTIRVMVHTGLDRHWVSLHNRRGVSLLRQGKVKTARVQVLGEARFPAF